MKYRVLIIIFLSIFIGTVAPQSKTPKIFKLNWGSGFNEVQDKITSKETGLSSLKHYPIYEKRSELEDLKLSSTIKYSSGGAPFFSIPSDIIFTFYNPEGLKTKLKLAKVEVYLSRKDSDRIIIDTRTIFKNFISIFCENYMIVLHPEDERDIFSKYNYQVTVNGIYVNFIGNIGDSVLSPDESMLISYENNELQNLILRKDLEIKDEDGKLKSTDPENEKTKNIKTNL